MSKPIADLRREYTRAGLAEADVKPDPLAQFREWLTQALAAELPDANAMTLATVDGAGAPHGRVVLLKDVDAEGFVFFTNYESAKGVELSHDPRAELVFYWAPLERQVRVHGTVTRVSTDESEAYFRTRPRGSRIAAWASAQSAVIADRAALEAKVRDIEARYPGDDVPRPPHWGGYRLVPAWLEYWQGRENRLHDRLRYVRAGAGWRLERLAP
ncbi:MAG TPA: pyridoxamine 5'-phosphate oxidase [Gemmatimonadales bacterium]|nr:pyridoxamine 5'-phosphate oxidase [Gemmatimonadales bacterium]